MAFFVVELQGIPVAVLRGDSLADAMDLVCNTHQTDTLLAFEHSGRVLWTENVRPVLVHASLEQVGMWAASFEAEVLRGGLDWEHASGWLLIFGEAADDVAPYQAVATTKKPATSKRDTH